jgi:N-acetylmuramoyl-L-alanine amidase
VRGVETFYASEKGKKLALAIQDNMVKKLRVKDRHTRRGEQYAVLNKTLCPAVLVECGYISNAYERKRCSSSGYQSLTASAIVDGILHYR